jgi:uncharacterized protein (DUF305 family)
VARDCDTGREALPQTSGAAFDRMFRDTIIGHHEDALTLTRTAKVVMPAVQRFAERLTQKAHDCP